MYGSGLTTALAAHSPDGEWKEMIQTAAVGEYEGVRNVVGGESDDVRGVLLDRKQLVLVERLSNGYICKHGWHGCDRVQVSKVTGTHKKGQGLYAVYEEYEVHEEYEVYEVYEVYEMHDVHETVRTSAVY
jgi:hypothetical protein